MRSSILPASAADVLVKGHGPPLDTANGPSIRTFCTRYLTVCFHAHQFGWDFLIASVSVPILGADFLCAHRLLVDVANWQLIGLVFFDKMLATGKVYQHLLAEVPALTAPTFSASVAKHGVEHDITTVRPPVNARARRLDAAKLAIYRERFSTMELSQSNSLWASPLHMVPKADGK